MASSTDVFPTSLYGTRTFMSRISSVLPQMTTLPSMMPFIPPPERYSKLSILHVV